MTRECGWTVVYEIAPPIVQMKHGKSSSSPQPPGTFFTVGSRLSLSWASSRNRLFSDWKSLSTVIIVGCSLFLGDCREDSFARILCLFQAEKRSTLYLPERESVIIELGWFIAGCSILLFRADNCWEDVLAHSLRLFQLRQETELSICAQEEWSVTINRLDFTFVQSPGDQL
jgi:hypothetical protein